MRLHAAEPEVSETDRVRDIYDRLAPRYDKLIAIAERLLFAGGRRWACGQARGDVLEVAVGTGGNLAFYPPGVHLTGIDVSQAMLDRAAERARSLDYDLCAVLQVGDAQRLDFADGSFDTVVRDAVAVQHPRRRCRRRRDGSGVTARGTATPARPCGQPTAADRATSAGNRPSYRSSPGRPPPPAARACGARRGSGHRLPASLEGRDRAEAHCLQAAAQDGADCGAPALIVDGEDLPFWPQPRSSGCYCSQQVRYPLGVKLPDVRTGNSSVAVEDDSDRQSRWA